MKEFVVRAVEEGNEIGISFEGGGMNQFERAGVLVFALFNVLADSQPNMKFTRFENGNR